MTAVAAFINDGEIIPHTATGAAVDYGDVVDLTTRIGVALADIAENAVGEVAVVGVFDLPAANDEAFTAGAALYWDGSALTTTAAYNTPAGWATEAKAETAAVGRVQIG